MAYDPAFHDRHSIRLKGYDYSQPGFYHVTMKVWRHQYWLSSVSSGKTQLSPYGQLAEQALSDLAQRLEYLLIDTHVLMPDHVHILFELRDTGTPRKALGGIVGMFKTTSAKAMNAFDKTPGTPRWHRNYYEQIVRDHRALNNIRRYIQNNPQSWKKKHPI